MNPTTLKALKASIEHWKKMRDDPSSGRPTGSECPLCAVFRKGGSCRGCPVFNKTGMELCDGTPYAEALDAYDSVSPQLWPQCATAEIDFLESLLPK